MHSKLSALHMMHQVPKWEHNLRNSALILSCTVGMQDFYFFFINSGVVLM